MLLAAVASSYLMTFSDPLARAVVGAARRLGAREREGTLMQSRDVRPAPALSHDESARLEGLV